MIKSTFSSGERETIYERPSIISNCKKIPQHKDMSLCSKQFIAVKLRGEQECYCVVIVFSMLLHIIGTSTRPLVP